MKLQKAAIFAAFFCLASVLTTALVKLWPYNAATLSINSAFAFICLGFCGVHEVKNPWKGKA